MKILVALPATIRRAFIEWFPWSDFAAGAIALCLGFLVLRVATDARIGLDELLSKDGAAFYGALLAAWTALLGFTAAIMAVVPSLLSSDRLDLLSQDSYNKFWASFTLAIRMLGGCVFLQLFGLLTCHWTALGAWPISVVLFLMSSSAVSLARAALGLELLLAFSKSSTDTIEAPNPPISPSVS